MDDTRQGAAVMARKPINLDAVDWIIVGSGVYLAPLNQLQEGAGTAFLRFDEGGVSSSHRHPSWEDLYVISGRLKVGEHTLQTGDFLHTPADTVHEIRALSDSVVLIVVPEPLEFL